MLLHNFIRNTGQMPLIPLVRSQKQSNPKLSRERLYHNDYHFISCIAIQYICLQECGATYLSRDTIYLSPVTFQQSLHDPSTQPNATVCRRACSTTSTNHFKCTVVGSASGRASTVPHTCGIVNITCQCTNASQYHNIHFNSHFLGEYGLDSPPRFHSLVPCGSRGCK